MRVGMCDCDCSVFVSGWVLGCSLSWISLAPPSNVEPISSLLHSLPVAGVSAHLCIGGSRCLGLGALMCAGSLPVAGCQGLGPLALSGLCLGVMCPRVLGLWVHGWICSYVEPGGGPPGVPVLWGAFGCLWLRSPPCLS
ncbi:hypothetical protein ATANTOWER_031330 [Ataeniobius toweri]|uniref:Uncharacterized protein n=1 Tax=Ataeniobius toweri TaxID=208326 RepID=A0ABU7B105_9TELE|nr:hypothetical protein [Ataeniobius toweri]